jgi:branched-chain amino acid transport system permease protein
MRFLVQLLIEGIEEGSVYALWALGYAIVYQVLGLMNFAFGDTLLLCLYLVVGLEAGYGMSPWLALLVALALAAGASMFVERQVYSRFTSRKQLEAGFIAALACAYVLRNIATAVWGNEPLAFPAFFGNSVYTVDGIKIASAGLVMLGVAVIVMVLFGLYLRMTKVGRGIVLAGQDQASAALIGIPVRTIVTVVFGFSGIVGFIGAALFANLYGGIESTLGFYITFQAFIAATVGGVGSLAGSVVGGLLLGIVESLAVGYVSGNFAQALAWLAMAVLVIVRPRGILGRAQVERV